MHYTYREEHVKCGKKGCKKCPHGPYLYKYWREDGRLRKKYCGKALPKSEEVPPSSPPPPPPPPPITWPQEWCRINHSSTAHLSLALEILGIKSADTREQVRKRYFNLVQKSHPDRGGDQRLFVIQSNAWAYVRSVMKWA